MAQSVESEEVDYQLGVHDIDLSGSIAEDDDVIEFEYEAAAVFKRLADDIYETPEAGVREPLTNAITSTRRAQRDFDVDDPVITITVQDGEQVKMRLRDTGEGITKEVLNEVLTVIGRSTARDEGEMSGMYGMGFLASYKLVGLNGGFIMCTNPRGTNEGPYSGLFKPGAFEPDKEGQLPVYLEEGEYGTVFEYFIKDEISVSDLREWVENHARWSPIPILYRELDEDGNERYNEDFHAPTLPDQYGDVPSLHVETPYYEAATSPAAQSDIILITSPVRMSGTRALRKKLPWSVDLRLKYENGLVIKGPHEGLVPVNREMYEDMDEERREKHVLKDDLTEDDLTLPEPTGTRENLRRHKEFLRHVNDQLLDQYLEIVRDTLDSFDPSSEAMQQLEEMERHVLLRIFSEFDNDTEYDAGDVEQKLSKTYDYNNPTDELVEFLLTMTQRVKVISEPKNYKKKYPTKAAHELVEDEERVFMTTAATSWKPRAVELSDEPTHLIKVDRASDYDPFKKHLGWTPLKEIKKSNATEMLELTEDQLENITATSGSGSAENVEDERVTLHYSSGGRNTMKRKAESLIDRYGDVRLGSTGRMGDVLLLFPRTGEYNVSDHYSLADNYCCVASCGSKVADYLSENAEGIMLYEDYADWMGSQSLLTSHGTRTVEDLLTMNRPVVFHPKKNPESSVFHDRIILGAVARQMSDEKDYDMTPVYALIEPALWTHIRNEKAGVDEWCMDDVAMLNVSNSVSGVPEYIYMDEVELYVKTRLSDAYCSSAEVRTLMGTYSTVTPEVVSITETLAEAAERAENGFASMAEDDEEEVRLPRVNTKYGTIPFDEVYNYVEPGKVLIHTLSPKRLQHFESDDMLDAGGESLSGVEVEDYNIPDVGSGGLYVPMLETEYERVKEHLDNDTIVLGQRNSYRERSVRVRDRYVYAALRLPNWSESDMFERMLRKASFSDAKNLVDSLAELHDNGEELSETEDTDDAVRVAQDALLSS